MQPGWTSRHPCPDCGLEVVEQMRKSRRFRTELLVTTEAATGQAHRCPSRPAVGPVRFVACARCPASVMLVGGVLVDWDPVREHACAPVVAETAPIPVAPTRTKVLMSRPQPTQSSSPPPTQTLPPGVIAL